jgi:hypothetical protein
LRPNPYRLAEVDFPVLRSYTMAEDWEGVVRIGLGLARPATCWTHVRQRTALETVLVLTVEPLKGGRDLACD